MFDPNFNPEFGIALDRFDASWRINSETPTIDLLKQEIDALPEYLLDRGNKAAAIVDIETYRKAETATRFLGDDVEQYHSHGILTMWVIAKVMNQHSQKLLEYNETRPVRSRIFTTEEGRCVLSAGLFHDFLGVFKQGEGMASAQMAQVEEILNRSYAYGQLSVQEVKRLITGTEYEIDSQNPVRFNPDGRYRFDAPELDIFQLLVVFGDLMQIGASDYKEMVEKGLKIKFSMPLSLALVTTMVIRELATKLGINPPYLVIPEEIRANVIHSLTNVADYDVLNLPQVSADSSEKYSPLGLQNFTHELLGIDISGSKADP